MKNSLLKKFIKLHLEANAVVMKKDDDFILITFNNHYSVDKYQMFLERKAHEAFFVHLDNLKSCNGDASKYLNPLQNQINIVLSEFVEEDRIFHKRLRILDKKDQIISNEELNSEILQKISSFISIQQFSLRVFLSKIGCTESKLIKSELKWTGKKTDLVELSNALFEGGFISSGIESKKEFMKIISNLFNTDLNSWEVLLNKAMLREKPTLFIDKLRAIQSDFYKKTIQ